MEKMEMNRGIIADYYSQHYEELTAFVCKQLMNRDAAEDIVQNIFLRLLSSDKMITTVTMPALVFTVARNLIYDYWRHRRSVDEYEHYLTVSPNCHTDDVLSIYSIGEITELLERGIARLSDKQRTVYRMSVYEGKKVSEISMELHINYKSVENRLGVARKEIRQFMRRMLA